MATTAQTNYHDIKTMAGNIHEHMELVAREMKKTERSYTERDYKFTWDGLTTYVGIHDMGITYGFTTRLRYWVSLLPIEEETTK